MPWPCSSSWTTSYSARAWPGRSSTRFRTPAKTPASRSPIASSSPSGATPTWSKQPALTRATSPPRCSPQRLPTTLRMTLRRQSTAATCGSPSPAPADGSEGGEPPALLVLGGLADDEVRLRGVGELHPAVLGCGAGHLDQRCFDPRGDLRLLLVASSLEPVDVHKRHARTLTACRHGATLGRGRHVPGGSRRARARARPRGGASASRRRP